MNPPIKRAVISAALLIVVFTILHTIPKTVMAEADNPSPGNQPTGSPTTLSLTDTFMVIHDTYIDAYNPNTNFGANPELLVGRFGQAPLQMNQYTLLAFDISALPINAVIESARVVLHSSPELAGDETTFSSISLNADAITSSWNENTVTWLTRPTQSNQGDPSTPYQPGFMDNDVTNVVTAWKTGSLANHGIALRLTGTQTGLVSFISNNAAMPNAPRLVVTYHTQGSPALLPVMEDTYIDQFYPGTNYGADPFFWVGGTTHRKHSLLKFDLSSLPEHIQVASATLKLYSEINRTEEPAPEAFFDLYTDLITSPWNEMTVTWNSSVQSTYMGDPAAPYNTFWIDLDVTNIVDAWAQGTYINNGILIKPDPVGSNWFVHFFARPSNYLPRLEIIFEDAPPPCIPITTINISGPSSGLTGIPYSFTAVATPPDASQPVNYTWQADDHPPYSGPSASIEYTWVNPGNKTVSVTAENCGGSLTTQKQVAISVPDPICEFPLTGVSIDGPSEGLVGEDQHFSALLFPSNTTPPISYSWDASGHPGPFNQPNVVFNWTHPGLEHISLSAANCGGTFETYQPISIIQLSDLPDLLISSAWYEPDQQRIGYLVKNQGGRSADAGFVVTAYRSGIPIFEDHFPSEIPAGGVRPGYLDISWTCSTGSAVLTLEADSTDLIWEQNEENNTWETTWPCDMDPPRVDGEVSVFGVSETNATIRWWTEKPARYVLTYGLDTYSTQQVSSSQFSTLHEVSLSGLAAGRSYFYTIHLENTGGQSLTLPRSYFQTKPPFSTPPVITNISIAKFPHDYYEFYTLTATVSNPSNASKAVFYWNDQPVGISLTYDNGFHARISPYAMGVYRDEFFAPNNVKVVASNPNNIGTVKTSMLTPPYEPRPIHLQFLAPREDHTIHIPGSTAPSGTEMEIKAYAYTSEWKCTQTGFSHGDMGGWSGVPCDNVIGNTDQVSYRITKNGQLIDSKTVNPTNQTTTFNVNLSGKPVGSYEITLTAKTGNQQISEVRAFHIVQGAPPVDVVRSITRFGNYFTVHLGVHNQGHQPIHVTKIEDHLIGFQQAGYGQDNYGYSLSTRSNFYGNRLSTTLEFAVDYIVPAGVIRYLSYQIVPVVYEQFDHPSIGHNQVKIELGIGQTLYRSQPGYLVNDPDFLDPIHLSTSYMNALNNADYLIITNPWKIHEHYGLSNSAQIEELQGTIARLARLKNGVIGYMQSYDRSTLKHLIAPGGWWADSMNPAFKQTYGGYVLLVGEVEVIPAWHEGTDKFTTGPGIPDWVPISDMRYADTAGATARPELNLGRIIGNNPREWVKTLRRTNDVYLGNRAWNGSSSISISGRGAAVTSDQIPTINIVADVLNSAGINSSKLHLYNYSEPNWFPKIQEHVPERDVMVLLGHGSWAGWTNPALNRWNAHQLAFGHTVPAIFAMACKTGHYEDGDDFGLAEAILNNVAAVYVGSTQNIELKAGVWGVKRFVRIWTQNPGWSFGRALTKLKQEAFEYDGSIYDHGKHLAFSYNLYGCPKYALSPGFNHAVGPLTATFSGEPSISGVYQLNAVLPPYSIEEIDGEHFVEIEGGDWLHEEGGYLTPVYNLEQELPPGLRVHSVHLISRGGLTAETGLNLPRTVAVQFCEDCEPGPMPPPLEGWFPALEQTFTWVSEALPDGGTRLSIKLHPFHYDPQTTDALYYQEWDFQIETVDTALIITSLQTDQNTYHLNSPVSIWLDMHQNGEPETIFINTEIIRQVSGEQVGALPLQRVEEIHTHANLSMVWESLGSSPGGYQVRVELISETGQIRAEAVRDFFLGIPNMEVTSIEVNPVIFQSDRDYQIDIRVQNSGDIPMDGFVMLEIYANNGEAAVFKERIKIDEISPGSAENIAFNWNTTGVMGDHFFINAAVNYDSQSSSPFIHELQGFHKLYLPLTIR